MIHSCHVFIALYAYPSLQSLQLRVYSAHKLPSLFEECRTDAFATALRDRRRGVSWNAVPGTAAPGGMEPFARGEHLPFQPVT
jgi:hypothetical protein